MKTTIISYEKKKAKNGEYITLLLSKQEDNQEIKAVIWNDYLKQIDINVIKNNAIIEIEAEHNTKYSNYTINKLSLIKEGQIGLPEDKRIEIMNEITNIANTIQDEKIKEFVLKTISKDNKILVTPAAKAHHHAFLGGLLVHTLQVVQAAQMLYTYAESMGKSLNYDLIVAGAICHDIRKIQEYNIDEESGDITINTDWQKKYKNHLRAGWFWAIGNKQPEIAHIIESHHGLVEWGAEQTPQTEEAWLVFLADMCSTKLAPINLIKKGDIL